MIACSGCQIKLGAAEVPRTGWADPRVKVAVAMVGISTAAAILLLIGFGTRRAR